MTTATMTTPATTVLWRLMMAEPRNTGARLEYVDALRRAGRAAEAAAWAGWRPRCP